jgi:hypothetical protein
MKFPEEFRWCPPQARQYHTKDGDRHGAFLIPGRNAKGRMLRVIAADGQETGWDHVSVSLAEWPKRCPSWDEMCLVKGLFWAPDVCVVQFHPAAADYVNMHEGVLHLWRSLTVHFPMPPKICV